MTLGQESEWVLLLQPQSPHGALEVRAKQKSTMHRINSDYASEPHKMETNEIITKSC